ncbi:ParB/RepB/Spo0J family partition protein [Deinococcus cavernae]|uniref:ParB/RepB/Spo0J family partition protein n=1 Tax=Deinococcus cavernae TaxID=2320857 RepID=A0A418VGV1_9DEIO|nr:ParB/RepB/Spo0J family partition protein [Deinococcus cavernae]RJF75299.1 ParB/RepB/Spo0J family partition protein [Deinococcus cavernae]
MSRKARPNVANLLARAQENVQAIEQSEAQRAPTQYLPVSALSPSPFQARRDFTKLSELVDDIREHGVLQPILVRPLGGEKYEIVAGERRWRASKEAGKVHIPAVVRPMSDVDAREFGLRENLQREDLNAYELARAVLEWTATHLGRPQDEVQEELGQNTPPAKTVEVLNQALKIVNRELTLQSYQRNYLALLRLPINLIEAIEQGASYSAVLALRPATPEQQREWLPKVIRGEWSRRQVRLALREAQPSPKPPRGAHSTSWTARWNAMESLLTDERRTHLDPQQQRKVEKLLQELSEVLQQKQLPREKRSKR